MPLQVVRAISNASIHYPCVPHSTLGSQETFIDYLQHVCQCSLQQKYELHSVGEAHIYAMN